MGANNTSNNTSNNSSNNSSNNMLDGLKVGTCYYCKIYNQELVLVDSGFTKIIEPTIFATNVSQNIMLDHTQ